MNFGNVDAQRPSATATTRTAMNFAKRLSAIVIAVLAGVLVGGCAGAVKETDRDTSGAYDGRWVGRVEAGVPSNVVSGNWKKNCTSGEWGFGFQVADGVIRLPLEGVSSDELPSGYVNAAGEFRLVVPRGSREVSSRESGSVGTSSLRWIFDGRLEEAESAVKFTVGDSKYGGAGCWWRLDLERLGPA